MNNFFPGGEPGPEILSTCLLFDFDRFSTDGPDFLVLVLLALFPPLVEGCVGVRIFEAVIILGNFSFFTGTFVCLTTADGGRNCSIGSFHRILDDRDRGLFLDSEFRLAFEVVAEEEIFFFKIPPPPGARSSEGQSWMWMGSFVPKSVTLPDRLLP